jgi:long-chain acyl-CoA synthetase
MPVSIAFSTIPEMFLALTDRFRDETRPLLMYKTGGVYVGLTYADVRRDVERMAAGLTVLGLARHDRVAIISENRPEWVVADLAIASLGAVDVPVYPTMTGRQTEFIFNDAGVTAVIVSNRYQLAKILKIKPDVPSLNHVIVMNAGEGVAEEEGVLLFSRVLELGAASLAEHPRSLEEVSAGVRPEDLLTIIYTSGTTGNPKGVVLSHGNLVSNIISSAQVIDIAPGNRMLSFLPLCHSFERMAGYYTAMACGATIAYAESVETVRDNMVEIQPHVITTVPRLFERIHSRILRHVEGGPAVRKKIFEWSIGVGRRYQQARKRGGVSIGLRLQHALADELVFGRLRAQTGGRLKFFVSGGAALPREFAEFFELIGLTILEGYGLTETSPVLTANPLRAYRFGSVGPAIPGVELKIAADGEILARGPNIMQGYWNNPAATAEAIDPEGWFHTGDIGTIDTDGYVSITDRKKHLFVSSGGKNIAPQPIENLFLSSRYIEQFVLIGDHRMFLTALIVPDFDSLRAFADAAGLRYSDRGDLIRLKEIHQLIETDIQQLQKDRASYERVRKFSLLDRPFSIEEGELTPSQKVRRKIVEEKYAGVIEGMYKGLR